MLLMLVRVAPLALLLAGCRQEPSVTIDEPWVDVSVPAGTTLGLRATVADVKPPGALLWGGDGGADVDSGASIVRTFAMPGTSTVTVSLADDGALMASRTISVLDSVPAGNYALRFGGTGRDDQDRVKIRVDDPAHGRAGPPVDIGATDFTIEFWLRAEPGANASDATECGRNPNWINGNVVLDRDRYSQGRKFGLSLAGERLVFGVTASGSDELTLCGATVVADGSWHHVAVTRVRATGALALFVDGRLDASSPGGPSGDISYPDNGRPGNHCGGPCVHSDPFLVLGAEKHDAGPSYPSFRGELDELRVSDTLRYAGPFAPPAARFEPDGRTAALYHFDEGAGTLARDMARRAGGPSHGVLMVNPGVGPTWVPSTAPTAVAP